MTVVAGPGRALRTVTAQGERLAYAAITALGVFAAAYGRQYGLTTEDGEVGPGMVPVVAGAILGLLGLALLVRSLRSAGDTGTTSAPTDSADGKDILGRTNADRVRNLWVVFGLLFLTINVVGILGLVVAFGLFVLVVFVAVERRPVIPSLVIAACACVFIQVVFGTFLRVPLPEGLLGTLTGA